MAGIGGFLGGLGEGVNSFVNMRAQEQQQQMRAAQLAQERLKMQQAQAALQAKANAANYLMQAQQQGSPPPTLYQPPGPSYMAAPPAMPAPGSGAPGASFAPVNPGAPSIGPGGRPIMSTPAAGPAPSLGGYGATAMRAPSPYAGGYSGFRTPNVFEIARGIALKNKGISPAALYDATSQTIALMKPLQLDQYRDQLLQLRAYTDMAGVENRIRDLDMKQQQGASRLDVERTALSVREAIVDLKERGADQRAIDRLTGAVAMIAAKAGIPPTSLGLDLPGSTGSGGAAPSRGGAGGGVAGALGAVAGAARANKNAKRQSADDDYHLQAKIRSEANQQIDAYLRKHNGERPLPGDLDFPAFTTLQNRRHAAAEKMTKLRAADPRLPAWNNTANSLTVAPSASQPPQAAINYLRANPSLAPPFDAKYGAGAAARVLGAQ